MPPDSCLREFSLQFPVTSSKFCFAVRSLRSCACPEPGRQRPVSTLNWKLEELESGNWELRAVVRRRSPRSRNHHPRGAVPANFDLFHPRSALSPSRPFRSVLMSNAFAVVLRNPRRIHRRWDFGDVPGLVRCVRCHVRCVPRSADRDTFDPRVVPDDPCVVAHIREKYPASCARVPDDRWHSVRHHSRVVPDDRSQCRTIGRVIPDDPHVVPDKRARRPRGFRARPARVWPRPLPDRARPRRMSLPTAPSRRRVLREAAAGRGSLSHCAHRLGQLKRRSGGGAMAFESMTVSKIITRDPKWSGACHCTWRDPSLRNSSSRSASDKRTLLDSWGSHSTV